jgi:hypothetical protein
MGVSEARVTAAMGRVNRRVGGGNVVNTTMTTGGLHTRYFIFPWAPLVVLARHPFSSLLDFATLLDDQSLRAGQAEAGSPKPLALFSPASPPDDPMILGTGGGRTGVAVREAGLGFPFPFASSSG